MLTPEIIAGLCRIAAGPAHGVNINSRLLTELLGAFAERDRLAAQVERVRALAWASDDGTRYGHDGHSPIDGYPECPGCWSDGILAMLDGADDE